MIRLFFALYILFLSVFPCSDRNSCADEKMNGITVVETGTHNHSSSEQDFCSPFCNCACCAVSVQVTIGNVLLPSFSHNTKALIPYQEKSLLNSPHSIWQPPRLA